MRTYLVDLRAVVEDGGGWLDMSVSIVDDGGLEATMSVIAKV